MKRTRRHSTRRILSVLALTCTLLPSVHGQSVWNAATGDWATPTNWTPAGVPNGVLATISNAGTATVSTVVAEMPTAINVGSGAGTSGRLDIVAGSLTTAAGGTATIGQNAGSGVLNIANTASVGTGLTGFSQGSGSFSVAGTFGVGGTLTDPTTPVPGVGMMRIHTTGTVATGDTLIGVGPGGDGKVFMESGTWNSTGAAGFAVGVAGGTGLMNMSGGNLSVAVALAIGYAQGNGTFNLADTTGTGGALTGFAVGTGSISAAGIHLGDSGAASSGTLRINTSGTITSGIVRIGDTGTGVVLMDAGTWTNSGNVRIGSNTGGVGTFTIGGGTFSSADEIRVATAGSTGTLNVVGGSVTSLVENGLNIGRGAGAVGTLNLSGGTVQGGSINIGYEGGDGTVNISGGELIGGGATGYINVGENGSTGKVIQTGGKITIGAWMAVGLGGTGPQAEYHISGGEVLGNAIEVGADRAGLMMITGTANVHPNVLEIATRATGNGTVTLNSSTAVVTLNELSIGSRNDSPGGQGLLNFQAGALNAAQANIGRGGPGTYSQSGGLATIQRFYMGTNAGAGVANLTGNGSLSYEEVRVGYNGSGPVTLNIADNFVMQGKTGVANPEPLPNTQHWGMFNAGENSFGPLAINQTGGTVAFSAWMSLGIGPGPADPSLQTYTISGGVIKDNRDQPDPRPDPALPDRRFAALEVGSDHGFTMNVLPGATINVQDITTGHRVNGNGIYNQSGGQVTVNGTMWAGREGRGTVNLSGGALSVEGLRVGGSAGANGAVNITGSTLKLNDYSEVGAGVGAIGVINVDGSTALLDGSDTRNADGNYQDIQVGINGGNGSINVKNGGKMIHNWWVNIARGETSTGQVTIDGAGSLFFQQHGLGRVNVGENGTGTLNITNGGKAEINEFYVGWTAGSVGTVNVLNGTLKLNNWAEVGRNGSTGVVNIDGPNALFDGSETRETGFQIGERFRDFEIGYRENAESLPGNGTVNIKNGGQMIHNWWVNIARGAGTTGLLTVDGEGSKLTQLNGRINVGEDGVGTMTVSNGGLVDQKLRVPVIPDPAFPDRQGPDAEFVIARNAGSTGVLNISDATSKVIANYDFRVGAAPGATGTVNITGGTLKLNGWTEIGRNGGTGIVNIDGPTAFLDASETRDNYADGYVGNANPRDFFVGLSGGNGTINIKNGGKMTHNWWMGIARDAGSVGQVTVDGAGSRFTNTNGHINVGEHGTGTLNVINGGVFDMLPRADDAPGDLFVGTANGSNGVVNLSGQDSVITVAHTLSVANDTGSAGQFNMTGGTVNIGGAFLMGRFGTGKFVQTAGTVNANGWVLVGADPSGRGEYDLIGGTFNHNHPTESFVIGRLGNADNPADPPTRFTVANTGELNRIGTGAMNIGDDRHGNGLFEVLNGGKVTNPGEINVGLGRGNPNVEGNGGGAATGLLRINNGTLTSGNVFVGRGIGADPIPDPANPSLFIPGPSYAAVGTVEMLGGTVTTNGFVRIGTEGGIGTLTMSGGTITSTGDFEVGVNGTGTLTHTGGTISAQNAFIGDGLANTPAVQVAGLHTGLVDAANSLNACTALTVRSGTVDVTGPILVDTASTLEVTGPTVLVNIPGPTGTATDGVLRSTSNTLQVNGTLTVDGGLGVVRAGVSGTTVSGTGIINADLNLINGATLAPGTSPGNLTVTGDLVFDASANYSVEILGGSLYDSVNVSGIVTLAGAQLSGLTPTPLTISSGEVFYIIRNMGVGAIDGIFAGAPDGSTVTMGTWTFQISYDANFETSSFDTGGNDVALKALIPEPASLTLLGSGLALMLVRRRRKA